MDSIDAARSSLEVATRGSAVFFALDCEAALNHEYDLIWCSSFLPLSDLVALAPHLAKIPKVVYFHENQLAYPVRPEFSGERDHHYGFSQMVTALVADYCLFNSHWNLDSFLAEAGRLLGRMPDAKPKNWIAKVKARSSVLGLPLDLPCRPSTSVGKLTDDQSPLILWNHRWEHDKAPEDFFSVLYRLQESGVPFRLAVCGERYARAPAVFEERAHDLPIALPYGGIKTNRPIITQFWQVLISLCPLLSMSFLASQCSKRFTLARCPLCLTVCRTPNCFRRPIAMKVLMS